MKKEPAHANPSQGFDFIGDVHGYCDPLERLLVAMGYTSSRGVYSHPEDRVAVFLGDLIDRGPKIRETLQLVRRMVEAGTAKMILGNHEFNAIAWSTLGRDGEHLRSHSTANGHQHAATLKAFEELESEWADWLNWFKTLPFTLDLGGCRAVHATWDDDLLTRLGDRRLDDPDFLEACATHGTPEFEAVGVLLKGRDLPLPEGLSLIDKERIERRKTRVRWWVASSELTYREAIFPLTSQPASASRKELNALVPDYWPGYGQEEPPVFFGHYWLSEDSNLEAQASNVACLDYSIAAENGRLVAYRWHGEKQLDASKFHWSARSERNLAVAQRYGPERRK